MPEGTEETVTTEPAAPEAPPEAAPEASLPPGVQEPAPEETPEQAGPDLSDAIGQLRDLNTRLDRAGVPSAQEEEPSVDRFLGVGEDDYGYEDDYEQEQPQYGQQQQQQQPLTEEQQAAQQLQAWVDNQFDAKTEGLRTEIEMGRREDGVRAFAKENPQLLKPEVMQATDGRLRAIDPNFGQPGYAPSREALETAYLAAQAELAQQSSGEQTSTGPEGSEQGTAEAVGQTGANLETGAGPGAPAEEVDPYIQALTGGRKSPNALGY